MSTARLVRIRVPTL
ncbi:unnamed protein product, partial [Allacma fusca]